MLQRTFLHLPGIGELSEQRLWREGIASWSDFIAACESGCLRSRAAAALVQDVCESVQRFGAGDWSYFDRALPSIHKWRAFGDLAGQALYVDIETTGMGPGAEITVIGTFDGREAKAFVAGRNLDDARAEIERHALVVTYNGAQFDMPIIRARFPGDRFNHVHVDLRFPLRRLGLKGGLKSIEDQVGIRRSARTAGLTGWDAVRLWREYRRGSREALDLLLEYNREDIRNLAPLMKLVCEGMASALPGNPEEPLAQGRDAPR